MNGCATPWGQKTNVPLRMSSRPGLSEPPPSLSSLSLDIIMVTYSGWLLKFIVIRHYSFHLNGTRESQVSIHESWNHQKEEAYSLWNCKSCQFNKIFGDKKHLYVGHWHCVCCVVTNLSFWCLAAVLSLQSMLRQNEAEVVIPLHSPPLLVWPHSCDLRLSYRCTWPQQRRKTSVCPALRGINFLLLFPEINSL